MGGGRKDRIDGQGYRYSHASISIGKELRHRQMMSFSRKHINKVFSPCLQYEDINRGMFAYYKNETEIVVAELKVPPERFDEVHRNMLADYRKREQLSFNYLGLLGHLFRGKGLAMRNKFFCSQWVAKILEESAVHLFKDKSLYDVKPNDFYIRLREYIIYEGPLVEYPHYSHNEENAIEE